MKKQSLNYRRQRQWSFVNNKGYLNSKKSSNKTQKGNQNYKIQYYNLSNNNKDIYVV